MKKIQLEEQQTIMLDILRCFDNLCRDNDVKYTLIGGSLIGAIRHKGFIPWDDDIDVAMTKDNFDKILPILKKEKGRYQLLSSMSSKNAFIFEKFVDTKTYATEPNMLYEDPSYGVYLDIFTLHNVPDDEKEREKTINKSKLLVSLFSRKKLSKEESLKQNFLRFFKNIVSKIIGYKRLNRMAEKHFGKYDDRDTKFATFNWPLYSNKQETRSNQDFREYIDADFEDMKAMIVKNYDNVLRETFGDYMKMPPKEKRVNKHGIKAYWRDEK